MKGLGCDLLPGRGGTLVALEKGALVGGLVMVEQWTGLLGVLFRWAQFLVGVMEMMRVLLLVAGRWRRVLDCVCDLLARDVVGPTRWVFVSKRRR